MRAFVLERPGAAGIRELPDPVPEPGEVLVAVARVGLCGTDRDLFDGALAARLGPDAISYPRIPGHEWTGTIVAAGPQVDRRRIGERVVGDTFIGCGTCSGCRQWGASTCPFRTEIGVRGRDELPVRARKLTTAG